MNITGSDRFVYLPHEKVSNATIWPSWSQIINSFLKSNLFAENCMAQFWASNFCEICTARLCSMHQQQLLPYSHNTNMLFLSCSVIWTIDALCWHVFPTFFVYLLYTILFQTSRYGCYYSETCNVAIYYNGLRCQRCSGRQQLQMILEDDSPRFWLALSYQPWHLPFLVDDMHVFPPICAVQLTHPSTITVG